MIEAGRLLVLYGSQSFTAQEAAERIWRKTKALGFRGPVQAMDEYPIPRLIQEEFALFVCATTGQGDEPDNMKRFWKFLLRKSLPTNSLVKLKFGVLAFGDSTYPKFNFAGKKLHKRLIQLGATPLMDVGLCDYQHDLGHDAVMQPWLQDYFSRLKTHFPNIQMDNTKTEFMPRWKVSLLKYETVINSNYDDIYFGDGSKKDLLDPMLLEVQTNLRTTAESHFQDVRLIKFKTTNDAILDYNPGDVFNIRPKNSPDDIEDLFGIFEMHNLDIKPDYTLLVEECYDAEQFWDLKAYPTQYVFSLLATVSDDRLERDKCLELSSPEGQEDWLNYCRRPRRTILEVLHDFHKSASKLTIEILFELFSSIKPRSFSIASASLPSKGREIELLIAVVNYKTKLKKPRLGLASNWLKTLVTGDKVYGWIKKGSLKFPEPTTSHIMVGPGTGLAPFRSLIQSLQCKGEASNDALHLFFGCRGQNSDFHCKDELMGLVHDGKLTLYCAFSRDQERKIYVQHKIAENASKLWDLIQNKNGHIFISGNSKNMPDNVRDAFIQDVFCKAGRLSLEDSRRMLDDMETNGRLQVETW